MEFEFSNWFSFSFSFSLVRREDGARVTSTKLGHNRQSGALIADPVFLKHFFCFFVFFFLWIRLQLYNWTSINFVTYFLGFYNYLGLFIYYLKFLKIVVFLYGCMQVNNRLVKGWMQSPVTFIDSLPFYDHDQPYFNAIRAIYPRLKLAVTGLSIEIKINRFVAILFEVCNMAYYYHIKHAATINVISNVALSL